MQDISAVYDDSQLQQLFAAMEPKRRLKTMRGAFRREAGIVRRTAISNLRSTGIRTDRDLEKGVRAIVFREKAGFRVTVGTKKANKKGNGEYGFHVTRAGLKKPILIWAETGTEERYTRQGVRSIGGKRRSRHATGRMKRYGYMSKTLQDVKMTVTGNLHKEVIENIKRTAKKYGCK